MAAALGGLVLLALGGAPLPAQQVESLTVRAPDGLALGATLYRSPRRGPLVLLFHQCNRPGAPTGYERLGPRLAAAGLSALALDFRGFGRSTNAEYPDFRRDMERAEARWPGDVDAVLAQVGSRADLDTSRVAVVGASCGVDQGIRLAGRRTLRALVALSGSLTPAAESTIAAIPPLPVFVAFAEHDRYDTPRSMRSLFAAAGDARSRMVTYKGASHGTPLLAEDPALEAMVVGWLSAILLGRAAPASLGTAPEDSAATAGGSARNPGPARGRAPPRAAAVRPLSAARAGGVPG